MQTLRDTLLIFRHQMRLSLRNPVWVVIGLIQPILYLAFFGPLLTGIARSPGFPSGNAWQVFVPGLLVQLGLSSTCRSEAAHHQDVAQGQGEILAGGRDPRPVLVLPLGPLPNLLCKTGARRRDVDRGR